MIGGGTAMRVYKEIIVYCPSQNKVLKHHYFNLDVDNYEERQLDYFEFYSDAIMNKANEIIIAKTICDNFVVLSVSPYSRKYIREDEKVASDIGIGKISKALSDYKIKNRIKFRLY